MPAKPTPDDPHFHRGTTQDVLPRFGGVWRIWGLPEMMTFPIRHLLDLEKELGRYGEVLSAIPAGTLRSEENRRIDATRFAEHRAHCSDMGLTISAAQIDRILAQCESADALLASQMAAMVQELGARISDECAQIFLVELSPKEKALVEP